MMEIRKSPLGRGWGWVKNCTRKIETKENYLNEAKNSYTIQPKVKRTCEASEKKQYVIRGIAMEIFKKKRQTKLESLGVRFLRFNDLGIKKNMSGVLSVIGNWIREHTNKSVQCIPCLSQEKEPTPSPSKEGNSQKQKPKKGI